MNKVRITKFTLLILTSAIFGACGGGSNNPNPPEGNTGFVIGGTVTGLVSDKQIVLQNNEEDELKVVQNGNFAFNKIVFPGANYSVAVKAQPDGLNCTVDAGSGKATADIENIKVACTPSQGIDIAQIAGNWDLRASCRTFWKGAFYAHDTLDIGIEGNSTIIKEGVRVYEYDDCKTKFLFAIQSSGPSTATTRSAFVHEGIPIFRLSLLSDGYGTRLRVYWMPHQQKNLCWMEDGLEKTDEAVGKMIVSLLNSPSQCYSRPE
ncbi:hypothetical protein [Diaphorobacter caeni]|uniref:hypothetical protein n=1 Tax=Diaphorobacter caeni TaxID=2784387 RepID=UPI00188E2D13|nr:hypothetical protein [Diaphorobacter caeni]MBF5005409.1 hypothetical protein [Diaphorobacter caeni]